MTVCQCGWDGTGDHHCHRCGKEPGQRRRPLIQVLTRWRAVRSPGKILGIQLSYPGGTPEDR